MKLNMILAGLALLLFPVLINAQTPPDACSVASYWTKQNQRGSLYFLGQFRPEAFDRITTKSFAYSDTKLIVSVSVQYAEQSDSAKKGQPSGISIALAISDKETEDVFDLVDNAVAETSYGKRWGELSVKKQTEQGEMIYTFIASCTDGSKLNKKRK